MRLMRRSHAGDGEQAACCCRVRLCETAALEERVGYGILAINIDRVWNDIEALGTFSAGNTGVNRLTFSDEDRAARAYLRAQLVSVGFEVVEIPPGIMLGASIRSSARSRQ